MQSRSKRVARRRKLSSQAKKRSTFQRFMDRFPLCLLPFRDTMPYASHRQILAKSPAIVPLSAARPRGRRRRQPVWILSTAARARVTSWHRPSDSTTASGNPFPSTTAWRLLVEPPQVLPTRWPPFCSYKRAIQCTFFEIKFSFEFKLKKEHVPYTGKGSILCPSPMSSPCRDITAVFRGKIAPSTPCRQDKKNGFESPLVIGRGAARSGPARKMRLYFRPLRLIQAN